MIVFGSETIEAISFAPLSAQAFAMLCISSGMPGHRTIPLLQRNRSTGNKCVVIIMVQSSATSDLVIDW